MKSIKLLKINKKILFSSVFILVSIILFTNVKTVSASFTFVQSATSDSATVSMSNVVAGDVIVMCSKNESGTGGTPYGMNDGTTSFTIGVPGGVAASTVSQCGFIPYSFSSGTVNYVASPPGGIAATEVRVAEFSHTLGMVVSDASGGATGSGANVNSGNITTTGTDDIVIGFYGENGTGNLTVPKIAGQAAAGTIGTGTNVSQMWYVSTTTTFTGPATGTNSGVAQWGANIMALKIVGGLSQSAFRFRNDDGSESAATALASENTNITQPLSTNIRLRAQASTTGDVPSVKYQLEYKKSTETNYHAVSTTTLEYYTLDTLVTASGNDAFQTGTTVTINGATIGASLDAITEWAGFRFTNITIPAGATIRSAYITVCPTAGTEDEPLVDITFQDADNAAIFTTGASDITNRSRAATTSWSSANLGSDGLLLFNSPDLSASLQPVINRAGWASGNALAVIMEGGVTTTRDLTVKAFDGPDGAQARLHVVYSIPAKISLSASSNIGVSGENTTALLSVPNSKSFTAGRIQDDENPSDAVDIASANYSEFEWNLITSSASNGDIYTFQVTASTTPFFSYAVTPQWTIGTAVATYIRKGIITLIGGALKIAGGRVNIK